MCFLYETSYGYWSEPNLFICPRVVRASEGAHVTGHGRAWHMTGEFPHSWVDMLGRIEGMQTAMQSRPDLPPMLCFILLSEM